MKKLTGNIAAKAAAVLLSFVAFAVLTVSCIGAVAMVEGSFYTRSEEAILADMVESEVYSEIWHVSDMIFDYTDGGALPDLAELEDTYSEKNLRISLRDEAGEVLYSNETDEEIFVSFSYGIMSIREEEAGTYMGIYRLDRNGLMLGLTEKEAAKAESMVQITVSIPKKLTFTDEIAWTVRLVGIAYSLRFAVYFFAAGSLLVLVVMLLFLLCAAGHKNGREGVALSFFDRVPFDLVTAAMICLLCLCGVALIEAYDIWTALLALALAVAGYFLCLWYCMSFAVRVKTRTLLRNTVIYKLWVFLSRRIKRILRFLGNLFRGTPLVLRTLAVAAGFCLIQMICYVGSYYTGARFFWWLVFSAVTMATVLYLAVMLKRIKTGGEKITAGDLEHKIDTQYMVGDLKEFSESLNHIGLGLQSAVNEKMKSERFRTELITNVSHDIKTPLTSIINYVDLMKKEEIDNETVQSYIEVLDRQSERLKKLIEDLMEASKASTGNLSVTLAECEVGVLLSQVIGEFDDRLAKACIKPVLKQPEEPVRILADGQHLWRVFGNLMSNVCKYSQPNTRVYLEVVKQGGKAVITFRNISKYELNISSDELMERFVRGDSSRNTEGSGLGLSIARSLVELQKGSMQLTVDGDLFKVSIAFDLL